MNWWAEAGGRWLIGFREGFENPVTVAVAVKEEDKVAGGDRRIIFLRLGGFGQHPSETGICYASHSLQA